MSGPLGLFIRAARGSWPAEVNAAQYLSASLLPRTYGSVNIAGSDICSRNSSAWTSAWGGHRSLHVTAEQSQQGEQRRGAYQVEVSIKSFEKRYLEQASTTIRDLMFINFAPKSASVLPSSQPDLPVNLFMPIKERTVPQNWKRTRFTVVRGPHIDKTGREQFEQRTYKTVLEAETHDGHEMQWFIDSLKFYDFPGVQLNVQLTSSNYLTPTQLPTPQQEASVLAEHRSRIARYLLPTGAPATTAPGAPSASQQQLLQGLRQAIHAGLHEQRKQLGSSDAYKQWHRTNKLTSPHTTAPAPEGLSPSSEASPCSDALLGQKLQRLASVATSSDPSVSSASKAAAFLAAVDAVFLSLNLDAAEAHNNFPYRFATYQVGQEVSGAEGGSGGREACRVWQPGLHVSTPSVGLRRS